jgi:hypothetical protein
MHRTAPIACDSVRHTDCVLHNGDAASIEHCVAILDGEILTQNAFESACLACDTCAAS